ncbi:MAG: DUF5309 family protein [Phycisphaeraceae bacterium]|nr:DUF5309 family protein [Phycisphaeraceae bacterium]MCW5768434.1 DUF5309 family protein [Phycisphaeraceae bacterium]
MPFTGKSTFAAGATLPELAEDVADIVSIVSPFETPLLDHLGDAKRSSESTIHEWIEDALLPNTDQINQTTFTPGPTTATSITVDNGVRFQPGDLVRPGNSTEVMLVTAVASNTLTVVRGYGSTTAHALANDMLLTILGNAALEGADANAARFTSRIRRRNYTQIFTSTVEVSGSMQAARAHGVADEMDFQKQERTRELLRDLENCVINGVAPASDPQGSTTVRRSMNGLLRIIQTNRFIPGVAGFPAGGGVGDVLNEEVLNAALRRVWEQSSARIDTIVVGGAQKRRINAFASAARSYLPEETRFRDMVSVYESDYGVCRVILSRWVPQDYVLMLDSSRVEVLPLSGRSFHFKPLAARGDAHSGQVIGEYTLECRNENAHAIIAGLAA